MENLLIGQVKDEIDFCESIELAKSENGIFIYESKDGKCAINLPFILSEYKDWLLEKKIVKLP